VAHTLNIVDGVEGTTLTLAGTPTSTGYHLQRYAAQFPRLSDQYNGSLYADGSRSVFGKAENIIETITVEVQGSSRDDLYVKLRALYRAIMNARDYAQYPGVRTASYIAYKPDSVTNTSYSAILGGQVDVPQLDGEILSGEGSEGELLSNTISGVVITIEREPFWRQYPPATSATKTAWSTALVTTASNTGNAKAWGALTIDGTTYAIIPGDLPALAELRFGLRNVADALTCDKLVVGYKSDERALGGYDAGGLVEAELSGLVGGSSYQADATASPGGGGNTKVRTGLATGGEGNNFSRCEIPINSQPKGTWRVFARMKLTGAATSVSVSAQYLSQNIGPAVTVTATSWRMYDLGVFTQEAAEKGLDQTSVLVPYIKLWAARLSGAAELEFDFIFLVPIDEYYISASGLALASQLFSIFRVGNITPGSQSGHVAVCGNSAPATGYDLYAAIQNVSQYTGNLRLPPGKGTLYWLSGDTNFGNILDATSKFTL
jgi:hypothetical protein